MIEDDPNDAELAVRTLRRDGFNVSWERVDQLSQIEAALVRQHWDVILSDHSIPGFKSADVIEMLTTLESEIPLIIVSGAIGEAEVVDLLHRGAASYVDKQSLSRLAPMVDRVLTQTRLRQENLAARRELELVHAAVDCANDLICVLEMRENAAPAVVYVNDAGVRLTGYTTAELMERGLEALHGPETDRAVLDQLASSMLRGEACTVELRLYDKAGATHWVENVIRPLGTDAKRYVSVSRDITERKYTQEQLAFLALHDPLTRLANRVLLEERLEAELARARRYNEQVAVMLIDLDGFKRINDTLGHAFGDFLLCEIAQRLRTCVREIDTVARLGGDEFVVAIGSAGDVALVEGAAARIVAAGRERVLGPGGTCDITVSIGISRYPHDGETIEALFSRADAALYVMKAAGKNGFRIYDPDAPAR
jgi:diguanylate cyclase (GGDEF)-like protein/PAS domain S-box-containing protein